ncbi:MAG: cytochrome c biogenesis protein CcsA [Alphaproteobacteria bacterium]|nr:cytochrome c biogenesis protein CcsA [Alphaproteobacteria bacterium]
MSEFTSFFAWLPFLSFLPAGILSIMRGEKQSRLLIALAFGCFVSFGWFYYLVSLKYSQNFSLTIFSTIFVTSLIYLAFCLFSKANKLLAGLLSPLMLYLAFLGGLSFSFESKEGIGDYDIWILLHVVFAMLTYALINLAALAALAVTIKETVLKRKSKSVIADRLPSVLDGNLLQFNYMFYAEILLGIGLITGITINIVQQKEVVHLDHKTLLTTLAFLGIALLIYLHRRMGLRGRKASHWILIAYLLVTAGYPGVKFVSGLLL